MHIQAIKTDLFSPNQHLLDFVKQHLPPLQEKTILVIASKILALSEGRTMPCSSKEEKHALAKTESDYYLDTKWIPLTIKDGLLMMAAGIDESNTESSCLLLPKDSFASASEIQRELKAYYQLTDLGIIISDSRLFPLRQGVIGGALGYAGFKGLRDYRGKKDLYGRTFVMESLNLADSLATTAIVEMGEGAEQQPLALITNAKVDWTNELPNREELQIAPEDDLYGPLLQYLPKKK